ncbi:unnamed protein product [Rhizophagus irregularis]|nr:unnamed protein product [Rhizophagus irregularis]
MKLYVRLTTIRVIKRFLNSYEISLLKWLTRTNWNIKSNNVITNARNNNLFIVTEYIEKNEVCYEISSISNNLSNKVELYSTPKTPTTPSSHSYEISSILNNSSNKVKLYSILKTLIPLSTAMKFQVF